MSAKILWGFRPDHAPVALKLAKYSRAEFERRKKEGWALEVCAAGEAPSYLATLTAADFFLPSDREGAR